MLIHSLTPLRLIESLCFDGEILLVRELVLGRAVARHFERLEHRRRDTAAEPGFLHERRHSFQMIPALLARHVGQVRRAVVVAARIVELNDDSVNPDLQIVAANQVSETMYSLLSAEAT